MTAPVLETDRLILRRHELGDFDAVAQMWAEPEVVRFITGTPSTPEESWTRLMKYIGHWSMLGYGFWAVILRETGAYVGDVGFANFRRDITPSLEGVPEAGWVLSPQVHGKGIATEAVACMHHWAETETLWDKTCCIFDPEHHISHRVAQRLGYQASDQLGSYRGKPTLIMHRMMSR
ncbi:GNAT family N-acetyltransferase [Tritonibacter mobilis]|nr:GNAT family N-acetyltransferase [Tritonibacter mobilis]